MTATRECRASKLRPESVLAATSFDPAYFYIEKNKVKINTFKNYGLYRKLAAACLFFYYESSFRGQKEQHVITLEV